MAAAFADLPEALANSGRDRAALQPDDPARQELPARLSRRPPASPSTSTCDAEAARRARAAARRAVSRTPRGATSSAPEYVARLEFETKTIVQMGFPGYFLIVADFINWAKGNGVPVGPGRGSGAGSLVAYALGITDLDPLRYDAAVRALPQSRARVDARLRHRLLPGRPRPRHRLRASSKYGADSGVADRDLRHDGGEGRGARRRPRARPALQLLRRHRQADPVPAGQADHARRWRARWSRCSPSARRTRRRCASCSRSPSRSKG